jgi:hypothetical protein
MIAGASPDAIAVADCDFYHTMDLPISWLRTGQWDLRVRFDQYVGGVSLAGRTVLDVGAASGFLSFEAERRGATVTSFEAAHAGQYRVLPFAAPESAEQGKVLRGITSVVRSPAKRLLAGPPRAWVGSPLHPRRHLRPVP